MFLNRYKNFLKSGGKINLKTDDEHLYQYTLNLIEQSKYTLHQNIENIYALQNIKPELEFKTYYEKMWLEQRKTIKYIQFSIN